MWLRQSGWWYVRLFSASGQCSCDLVALCCCVVNAMLPALLNLSLESYCLTTQCTHSSVHMSSLAASRSASVLVTHSALPVSLPFTVNIIQLCHLLATEKLHISGIASKPSPLHLGDHGQARVAREHRHHCSLLTLRAKDAMHTLTHHRQPCK